MSYPATFKPLSILPVSPHTLVDQLINSCWYHVVNNFLSPTSRGLIERKCFPWLLKWMKIDLLSSLMTGTQFLQLFPSPTDKHSRKFEIFCNWGIFQDSLISKNCNDSECQILQWSWCLFREHIQLNPWCLLVHTHEFLDGMHLSNLIGSMIEGNNFHIVRMLLTSVPDISCLQKEMRYRLLCANEIH